MIASAYHLDYNYLLSLWGYIESVNLELPAHLQELIEECKHFSEDDVNTLIQYANLSRGNVGNKPILTKNPISSVIHSNQSGFLLCLT